MYLATTLAYPCVLALLCAGAGLLVDRASGGWVPAALLLPLGASALIGVSQLTTYIAPLAPGTPFLMAALAACGLAAGAERLRALLRRPRVLAWPLAASLLAYLLALAPVLLSGRSSFSSFMALSDSAVHMFGADYLIHHGQDYSHVDPHSSYGEFIHAYYGSSYPSGADTLFGGSAFLLGLPLIWAFQPFNAFMLALAAGPAWLLSRRLGLRGGWAALAALSATVPALVYGYELVGSVKEIAVLGLILTLGALVVEHERWLGRGARGAAPFALAVAAGVSALGVGFGAWAIAATVVLVALLASEARGGLAGRRLAALIGAGLLIALLAALPTWVNFSGSLRVARNIASTSNPGNLHMGLHSEQLLGVWLRGSYKQAPAGADHTLTYALIALALAACAAGAVRLVRRRQYALAGWLAAMLATWLALRAYSTTWVDAKGLVLTSSAVVLLSWAGVAALLDGPPGRTRWVLGAALALVLGAGVLASDAFQYHSSNLAPTARYQELASLDDRFASRGPALFTDFDEYSLYVLRKLDLSGPDFAYRPAELAALASGYGQPVELDRAAPDTLARYPLIVARRDPAASPPPAAYALRWRGRYYEVWGRRPAAAPALAHVSLGGPPGARCARAVALERRLTRSPGARLVAASSPQILRISLARGARPRGWGRQRQGLVMSRAGTLRRSFTVPRAATVEVWLEGQIMPAVDVSVDGRRVATIQAQLAGNSLVPDAIAAGRVALQAGRHTLAIHRGGFALTPGAGGSAVLDGVFLAPAFAPARTLLALSGGGVRAELCRGSYRWAELLGA